MANELRDRLLEVLGECRVRERDELVPLVDAEAPQRGWTYKDHLAHLAAWRDHGADVLRAARGAGPVPRTIGLDLLDEENARIHALNKDRSGEDVKQYAFESYVRLAAELDLCTDEVLHLPRPDRPEMETWRVLPGDLETHLGMHLSQLLLERGDFDAAEKVEVWAYEASNRAAADTPSRAGSLYNLGCFYARAGRAGEAAERFRTAFAASPGLVEWARTDPDLDRVRDDPAVAELLAP